jgi:hypothetical protein
MLIPRAVEPSPCSPTVTKGRRSRRRTWSRFSNPGRESNRRNFNRSRKKKGPWDPSPYVGTYENNADRYILSVRDDALALRTQDKLATYDNTKEETAAMLLYPVGSDTFAVLKAGTTPTHGPIRFVRPGADCPHLGLAIGGRTDRRRRTRAREFACLSATRPAYLWPRPQNGVATTEMSTERLAAFRRATRKLGGTGARNLRLLLTRKNR